MTRSYQPVDLTKLKTYSAEQRQHKSDLKRCATLPDRGASFAEVFRSFPDYLGASAFHKVVKAVVGAVEQDRPVVMAFGAHVLKVGCAPIVIDLIQRGIIKAIATNGAGAIHDVELATLGQTSEEVADTIRDGSFGMVEETLSFFDEVVALARRDQSGLGAAVGKLLTTKEAPNLDQSVFATAYRVGIPATVHVALGTDTVHVSGCADGASWGEASLRDFRLLCDVVSDLGSGESSQVGGVWLNIGSAVILPEVFLKAVSVARNLGANLDAMSTANFDMIRHYRPTENVINRPVAKGHGHEVIGHHEILLPLFRQAVIEQVKSGVD